MKNLENRSLTSEFEVRNEEGKPVMVEGYAARFEEETVIGGAFVEKLSRSAFDGTDMSNTVALFNHDMNMPLARMGKGLELEVDEHGLKYRFELGEQSYAKDLAENIKRGIVSTSSFGFTVKEDSWEQRDGRNVRTLEAIDILFDVSPTTQGAYPTTEVGLRSMELAFGDTEEVVEVVAEEVTEDTEVREEEAAVEAVTEAPAEEPTPEVTEEVTEEENEEEAPASEEEEQIEADVEEDETEAEEEITPESEAGPADEEEDSNVRASKISSDMETTNNTAPAVVQSLGDNSAEMRKSFDFAKAIKEAANGQLTGVEADAHAMAVEEARSRGFALTGNVAVPAEWRADAAPMTAGSTGVQTNEGIFDDGQAFEKNFTPFRRLEELGVKVYNNASGDLVFPIQTGNIVPQNLDELADVDLTNVSFEQKRISPQRIAAGTSYSKEMLMQTSGDLGGMILSDLDEQTAIKVEAYVMGVIEAGLTFVDDSTGAVSGGASTTDFAELPFYMEQALREAHADTKNAKFLLNAAALRQFKRAASDPGSGIFVGTEANIAGYPFCQSQLITDKKVILGDFSKVTVARWGGLDLVVDPYTAAQKNVVNIIANTHVGAVVRHTGAFSAMTVA